MSDNPTRHPHILVVDDQPTNLRVVGDMLSKTGKYTIHFARSGKDALEQIGLRNPDLILLDVMMPEMSGYAVCQLLKKHAQYKDIPVIFLTALNQSHDLIEGFESGGVDFISKPFDAPVLLARVETHLNLYFLRQREKNNNKFLEEKVRERTNELIQAINAKDELLTLFNETQKAAHVGSWSLDLINDDLACSDEVCRMLEIDPDDLESSYEGFLDVIHPDDRNSFDQSYRDSIQMKSHFEIIHRLLMADDQIKWVIERGHHEYDSGGNPIRSNGMILDLTNQKHTEIRLEKAISAKDDFLASMSHELRTPLTSIIGNSELIAEKLEDSETQALNQAITHSARTQLTLVNDILDVAKIESGKFSIEELPYDFSALLQNIRQTFQSHANSSGLDFLVVQENSEEYLLIGDTQRITQILINLIGNAIKFTAQGRVTLTTHTDERWLYFTVQDTGIGMSPETIDGLFDRFQQADRSISRRFGGAGMGLFISLSLAEMMGGTIDV